MLQVVCVNVGPKFSPEYVRRLKRACDLHLSYPHDFAVITDAPENYDFCRTLPAMDGLEGYWQKVTLFADARGVQYTGNRILYLDLDVAIMGNIDELASYPASFFALKDQNIPCINSSIMVWDFDMFRHVYANFEGPEDRWGDQGYIHRQVWPVYIQDVFGEAQYPDFKENLKFREPISGEKVVWFHGEPHPHEVPWVQELWERQA